MYIGKGFVVLICAMLIVLFAFIFIGFKALEFNRSILTYRDRLNLLCRMDEISDTPIVMVSNNYFSKKILSGDELNKVVFYLTRVRGKARIPDRDFDIRIAFPQNNVDIYFIDNNSAAVWAKLPEMEYKFIIKHSRLREVLEKIHKNNASH